MTRMRIVRGIGALATTTLVASSVLLTASTAAQAEGIVSNAQQETRVEVSEGAGALDWGVRTSIRNYLETFDHTGGWVEAHEPATYRKGDTAAMFPVSGGWIDPGTQSGELTFDGGLEMFGFQESWLDFTNVRLSISGGEAEITVDMLDSYSTKGEVDDVTLATFELEHDAITQHRNGDITLESGDGLFPEVVGSNHLPRMNGEATYGPPNNQTDPFALRLSQEFGDDDPDEEDPGGEEPSDQDGKDDEPPEDQPVPVEKGAPSGESTATNPYGASITVSPAYSLADADQKVTLTGSGFPTTSSGGKNFGGLYVLFGWVDPAAGSDWGPGHGGATGKTYDYAVDPPGVETGTYQSMVNYPGNATEPGLPYMDANDFPLLASKFTGAGGNAIDCYRMQCGVMLIGAHGVANPEGEIFVPVYFTETADGTGNETPTNTNAGGLASNPNMSGAGAATGQTTGLTVNGGLVAARDDGAFTVLFAGLLSVSAGALGGALIFWRRRVRATRIPDTGEDTRSNA